MKAIIYVCHGSRMLAAREQAICFITRFMSHNAVPIQEYCFLEYAEPDMEEAFIKVIEQGATKVAVIPVLLLSAGHAKKDIPEKLRGLAVKFPHVEIIYGSPIGVHERMADLLWERIAETGIPITKNSMVLLVGRGSSDPDVKRDLNRIASILKTAANLKYVETCFIAAAEPNLEEGMQAAIAGCYDNVYIIPYLFFTGSLMNRIKNAVDRQPCNSKFHVCNVLGYHASIESILLEKIRTMLYDKVPVGK